MALRYGMDKIDFNDLRFGPDGRRAAILRTLKEEQRLVEQHPSWEQERDKGLDIRHGYSVIAAEYSDWSVISPAQQARQETCEALAGTARLACQPAAVRDAQWYFELLRDALKEACVEAPDDIRLKAMSIRATTEVDILREWLSYYDRSVA